MIIYGGVWVVKHNLEPASPWSWGSKLFNIKDLWTYSNETTDLWGISCFNVENVDTHDLNSQSSDHCVTNISENKLFKFFCSGPSGTTKGHYQHLSLLPSSCATAMCHTNFSTDTSFVENNRYDFQLSINVAQLRRARARQSNCCWPAPQCDPRTDGSTQSNLELRKELTQS